MMNLRNQLVNFLRLKAYIFQSLFVLLLFVCIGCNPLGDQVDEKSPHYFYTISKSNVYYSSFGNTFGEGEKELNADVESLVVLGEDIAQDKNHIYYKGYTVDTKTMDLNSFFVKPITKFNDICFDKDKVYGIIAEYNALNNKASFQVKAVEGANPATFDRMAFNWSKDDKNYYFNYERMAVDYATFQNLNYSFVKDKSKVMARFDKGFSPIDADPESFIPLDHNSRGRDSKNIYWVTYDDYNNHKLHTIPYSDASEISTLSDSYLRVSDKVYHDGKLMEGVDANEFEALNTN